MKESHDSVIPAKAGIQSVQSPPQTSHWIPAFAGMTSSVWRFHSMGGSQRHYFTGSETPEPVGATELSNAFQSADGFHVGGVRKQVDGDGFNKPPPAVDKASQIAGKRGGIA